MVAENMHLDSLKTCLVSKTSGKLFMSSGFKCILAEQALISHLACSSARTFTAATCASASCLMQATCAAFSS